MKLILDLLGLSWVRYAIAAIGIGSLVGGFALSNQRKGAEKERAKIERAADANAAKADTARQSVRKLPDDRLRDKYARD